MRTRDVVTAGECNWVYVTVLVSVLLAVAALTTIAYFKSDAERPISHNGRTPSDKQAFTKLIIAYVCDAIAVYREQEGAFPSTTNDLVEQFNDKKISLQVIRVYRPPLLDAWGNRVQYETSGGVVRVTSAGLDGVLKTGDDIVSTFQWCGTNTRNRFESAFPVGGFGLKETP